MKSLLKKSIYLFFLSLPSSFNALTTTSLSVHSNCVSLSSASLIAEYEKTLSSPQEIGTDTTDSPGVYIFSKSIEYNTSSTLSAAIIINSDNVTIDLNGQTLFCNDSVTSTIHGIQVKAGVKNIKIKHGTITGFTGEGISIEGSSSSKITNITIEDVKFILNRNGIIGTYVNNATLCNLSVNDSTSTDNTHGIHFSNSESISIKQTTSTRNVTTTSGKYVNGIRLTACKASSITNCICSNNQADSDATGIYITDTIDNNHSNEIIDCVCNNNISSNSNAHGIHLKTCDLVHVKNCKTTSNIASLASKQSYGIRLEDVTNATIEKNTMIRNNIGVGDDEPENSYTNIFIENSGYLNVDKLSNVKNYFRDSSTPIEYTEASVNQLEKFLTASNKSNLSIII